MVRIKQWLEKIAQPLEESVKAVEWKITFPESVREEVDQVTLEQMMSIQMQSLMMKSMRAQMSTLNLKEKEIPHEYLLSR